MKAQVEKFFQDYETRANKGLAEKPEINAEEASSAYTETFIEANPKGVMTFTSEQFREGAEEGFARQREVGARSMKIGSLDITPLDEFHAMAKIHWVSTYVNKQDKALEIDFDEIYFVQLLDDTVKVFAYIAGDQEGLLKENGIL